MEKIKVVWICHFSNQQIRKRIPLSKLHFSNLLRRLVGKPAFNYHDFAPWVTNLIKEFEKFNDVELHVIAPHYGLIRYTSEFELNGVYYHFFKPDLPLLFVNFPERLCLRVNRFLVKRYLKVIKPDIVNLIGAENAYYSITSLEIKTIPVYVSAQTVYSNPLRKMHSGSVVKLNWYTELKIHRKEQYFGCAGRMHRDLILGNNPEAIIFKMFFPLERPYCVKEVSKIFDFVFFAAGVTKKKGIEEAINALALVKKQKHGVTLNVVGKFSSDYKTTIQQKIISLNLEDNISFNDYFPIHADMHQHLKKARFALLPNKLDVISGTVIEAIFLELPVVTFKTSGTPYLNKDGEIVLLADIGNEEKLAENMLRLLNEPQLGFQMKRDAKAFVEREFDNTASAKRLLSNYKAVINHYHHNIPIPKEQLFSTDEFPIY